MKLLSNKWVPAIVMILIIFLMSSVPGQTIRHYGLGNEIFHVNGHFVLFFMLALSFYKAVKTVPATFILTVGYAFLDELHQYFVPLRSISAKDLIVDAIAAFLACLVLWPSSKLKIWLSK